MNALLNEPALYSAKDSDEDLSNMTKTELITYATEHGVEGVSSAMRKAEIIAAIEGAL